MQATEAEKKSESRNDDSINFRPSPNFKHMKKYLKSKFEEMNSMNASNGTSEVSSPEETENKQNVPIQPPLPPNPPPPDSPISKIKQEVEDDEYQSTTPTDNMDTKPSDEVINAAQVQSVPPKREPTMCRNYVRGTCKKGSSCIFVHELILSQLPGVYTFCKNFQNKQCVHAKCKFVHATVFEKEYFFRTGYLPPHTTAHIKRPVAPPLPPPPPPPPEEPVPTVPQIFPATPTFDTSGPIVPVVGCDTILPNISGNSPDMYSMGAPDNTNTATKRDWSASEEFTRSPRDVDSCEPIAKKCKDCDTNEFRLQYMKNKVEKMYLSSQERNQKMAVLDKKYQRLCSVLITLFKPNATTNANILGATLNLGSEKDQLLFENLKELSKLFQPGDASVM